MSTETEVSSLCPHNTVVSPAQAVSDTRGLGHVVCRKLMIWKYSTWAVLKAA